jgi:hypothetical protein
MEKLNYNRPMMFYQDACGLISSYNNASRVRIVYPDGKVEWASLAFSGEAFTIFDYGYTFGKYRPCYLEHRNRFKNAKEAIEFIHEFDKKEGYQPMEFLGYL